MAQPHLITAPDRFFIGGEWTRPSSNSRIDVITPSTEEVFVSVAEAQPADVKRAVAARARGIRSRPLAQT